MTNNQAYSEAIRFMTEAAASLDQAQACIKDLGYVDYLEIPPMQKTIQRLLADFKREQCPDCGHLISRHEDKYGCDHELGDEGRPCSCGWGQSNVNPKSEGGK